MIGVVVPCDTGDANVSREIDQLRLRAAGHSLVLAVEDTFPETRLNVDDDRVGQLPLRGQHRGRQHRERPLIAWEARKGGGQQLPTETLAGELAARALQSHLIPRLRTGGRSKAGSRRAPPSSSQAQPAVCVVVVGVRIRQVTQICARTRPSRGVEVNSVFCAAQFRTRAWKM